MAAPIEHLHGIESRHVLFGFQKGVQHLEAILEFIDVFLLEQPLELLFFLSMSRFHGDTLFPKLKACPGVVGPAGTRALLPAIGERGHFVNKPGRGVQPVGPGIS